MMRYKKLTLLEPDCEVNDKTLYAGTQSFVVELGSLVRFKCNPPGDCLSAVRNLDPLIEKFEEGGDFYKIGDPRNHPSWREGRAMSANLERSIPAELARNFLPEGFPLFVRNLPRGTTVSDLENMIIDANSPQFKDACIFVKPKDEVYSKFRGAPGGVGIRDTPKL